MIHLLQVSGRMKDSATANAEKIVFSLHTRLEAEGGPSTAA